jgi:hypothetical protein
MSNRKPLLHLRSLPPTVLALAAVGMSGPALAQTGNAATGAGLYTSQCAGCHQVVTTFKTRFTGATEAGIKLRIDLSIANNAGGVMGLFSTLTPQNRADLAAYIFNPTAAPPPPPPPPPLTLPPGTPTPAPAPAPTPAPAPAVPPSASPTATPNPAMFSSTEVGAYSATAAVLVTNSTSAAITFASPALTPPAGTTNEFIATRAPAGTANCAAGLVLEPGVSCSFGVQFAPLAAGTRTEKWMINFAETGVPAREVTLEGTAIGGAAAATSASTAAPTAANAPTDGGGGAFGWLGLLGLAALAGIRRTR